MSKKLSSSDGKGFYLALYSCVGVVLILAAVFSFRNIASINNAKKLANEQSIINADELEMANSSTDTGYITPEDRVNNILKASKEKKEEEMPKDTDLESKAKTKEENDTKATPEPSNNETGNAETSDLESTELDTQKPDSDLDVPVSLEESNPLVLEEATPVFKNFTGTEKMNWPIDGEVVMGYSSDAAIYDVTLDQYRTNDTLAIAANVGDQVKAASDGKVISIDKSRENGYSVVIDHGQGWNTTYSQLQELVLVAEGDVVKAGQVIAGVGSPSIYGVLLGNHLSFSVSKDGKIVDPNTVLSNN
jgi:murein DD-endopeptidase MepM/ murein hydrolase activator NlpD